MPESNDQQPGSGSFAKVFLPGLVLGLVVGGVGGAFLPDYLDSANADVPRTQGDGALPDGIEIPESTRDRAGEVVDETGEAIGEAVQDAGQAIEDSGEAIEEAAEDAGDNPPSDD